MDDNELIRKISSTGRDRVTLYLSQSKVEHVYVRTVAQIVELVRSARQGAKLSGSILGFLGTEIGAEGELEAKVAITTLLQAIAAEKAAEQAGRLVDLTKKDALDGSFLRYIGPGWFTGMTSDVSAESAAISSSACAIVTKKRRIQQEILQWKNKDVGTVVLTFTTHNMICASIASTESLNLNLFASYHEGPHFGILCRKEGVAEGRVNFLDSVDLA